MASTNPVAAECLEADVLRDCLAFLRLKGAQPRRHNVGAVFNTEGQYVAFGAPGEADIQAVVPNGSGRVLWLETKATGYRPRGKREKRHFADQIAFLNAINAAGGVGLMVDRLDELIFVWPYIMQGAKFHMTDDGTCEVYVKGGAQC